MGWFKRTLTKAGAPPAPANPPPPPSPRAQPLQQPQQPLPPPVWRLKSKTLGAGEQAPKATSPLFKNIDAKLAAKAAYERHHAQAQQATARSWAATYGVRPNNCAGLFSPAGTADASDDWRLSAKK